MVGSSVLVELFEAPLRRRVAAAEPLAARKSARSAGVSLAVWYVPDATTSCSTADILGVSRPPAGRGNSRS